MHRSHLLRSLIVSSIHRGLNIFLVSKCSQIIFQFDVSLAKSTDFTLLASESWVFILVIKSYRWLLSQNIWQWLSNWIEILSKEFQLSSVSL